MTTTRGIDLGLVTCEACELVMRCDGGAGSCIRCGEPVHPRKIKGMGRTWALLIAACVLYLPANLLPMMRTSSLLDQRSDTILSGVQYLWREGSVDLAILVFTASIVVPLFKLTALGMLLVSTRHGSIWRPRGRTVLYRALERMGHWSMLDVFVVALLATVVQLGRFANIEPGPAVLPFAAVVVLTMLASASFDPREIWDHHVEHHRG